MSKLSEANILNMNGILLSILMHDLAGSISNLNAISRIIKNERNNPEALEDLTDDLSSVVAQLIGFMRTLSTLRGQNKAEHAMVSLKRLKRDIEVIYQRNPNIKVNVSILDIETRTNYYVLLQLIVLLIQATTKNSQATNIEINIKELSNHIVVSMRDKAATAHHSELSRYATDYLRNDTDDTDFTLFKQMITLLHSQIDFSISGGFSPIHGGHIEINLPKQP